VRQEACRALIVKRDSVAEGKWPEVVMIVLGPMLSSINCYCTGSANGVLDGIFSNSIVAVASNANMLNALTLGGKFSSKLLGGIDSLSVQ
jgi:hypothetical protein